MNEEWKDIEGYWWIYQISNLWRVRVTRILSPEDVNWYERLQLWKWWKSKKFRVHRLVADAFIGKSEDEQEVNHIDWVKNNNKLDNLEYCTRSENMLHAYKIWLCNKRKK